MKITVSDLCYAYGNHRVLDHLSFSVGEGELACVLGANGVGKSTLFRNILRIQPDYTGSIKIDGEDTAHFSTREMAKRVAYIPQSHATIFSYQVLDMVLMGTTVNGGYLSKPGQRQRETALEKLEQLGILELQNRDFSQISGGERQLVLIARALAQEAKILIMDEPTANLDYGNQIKVLTQIRNLAGSGYTILLATHQPDQAFLFADQVIAIKDGSLYTKGQPEQVITHQFMREIYGVDVALQSVYHNRTQVCVPVGALR